MGEELTVIYEDESYVRLYTNDTASWSLLGWEGQTVLMHMLRGKFDRAGVFDCGRHEMSRAVTAVTRLPADLVERGLKSILEEGTWVVNGTLIVWPNYVEAQTCSRSDRARQAESRKNRRDSAVIPVTEQNDVSQNVTTCHDMSQVSRNVTLSLALPSLTKEEKEINVELPPDAGFSVLPGLGIEPKKSREDIRRQKILAVFEAWKEDTGHTGAKLDKQRINKISDGLANFSVEQLIQAIRNRKRDKWLTDNGYDQIKTLLRDVSQIERLLALPEPKQSEPISGDVSSVHLAWQQALRRQDKLFGPSDNNALVISQAIDAYGFGDAMLVAKYCPLDGMVSGRDDQNKVKHESMAYIFGNTATFGRILKMAKQKEAETHRETMAERTARLSAL